MIKVAKPTTIPAPPGYDGPKVIVVDNEAERNKIIKSLLKAIPMNSKQVRALTPGDKVHWTDPDADLCSRTFIIQTVEVCEDEEENDEDHVVFLTDTNGGELECNASELTKVD